MIWFLLACTKKDEHIHHGPRGGGETSGTTHETIDPDPQPDPDPVVVNPVDEDEVCYPGPAGDFSVCLPVFGLDVTPSDYDYPAPLNGSDQYLAPVRYLWLEDLDDRTELAANFQLVEMAEIADGAFAVVQPHAVVTVQELRDELGPLVVNSGYRNPAHNDAVGGATWSRHMYGDGFDLDPSSATLDELADACAAHGAAYVGVYEAHIHCDWRDDPLEPAFFPVAGVARSATPRPVHAAFIREVGGVLSAPAEGWDEGEPLRVWRAYGADGALLDERTGRTYQPPDGAVEVEVEVGRAITVTQPW